MSAALALYLDRLESHATRAIPSHEPCKETPAGLVWRCAALIAAHLTETTVLLASWVCIGSGALSGRFDAGWLAAWALALMTTVPLRASTTWLQGVVAIRLGGMLKRRLLTGAMALEGDEIRAKGSGELMSEVLEAEAVDDLGASGGIATLLAVIELLVAPLLFLWGAGSAAEIAVIIGWEILAVSLFVRNIRLRTVWTRQRVALTHMLVENMTAHRTRVAQQDPGCWHANDDEALAQYVTTSRILDRGTARIEAALPRGYVIAAVAALAPAFLSGSAPLSQLAITLGTILFAAGSFERLCYGYTQSAAAWIAWKMIRPIFDAAVRVPLPPVVDAHGGRTHDVLQARGLSFVHDKRREPVLRGCNLSVKQGDQILLQGPSGSGKSTLAAILAGSRAPSEGYVLSGGLDRHTLGDAAWRRRIALAPQYHENHVVTGTLVFNLLMGRAFPYSPDDIEEAEAVCRELGLRELLEHMPAGLNQMVGDTGWRLSQGERSRIFLARALLQSADIVMLDESLAALDPQNLRQCLECIMRRSPTLIVIAHP